MKILAFAATNSSHSINRQLVDHAVDLLEATAPGVEVEVIDLHDYEMPIYSVDREAEHGIPDQAKAFHAAIGSADGLIISFAEHNGNYTAAFKNLYDWTSRIDQRVFQDTPGLLLATSPGPGGGANVLGLAVTSAPYFGLEVVGSLSIPAFHDAFDPGTGQPTDPETGAELTRLVAALTAAAVAATPEEVVA